MAQAAAAGHVLSHVGLYTDPEAAYFTHDHSFTYTASGATITAQCGGEGDCDITEGLKLTLTAPKSLTYDGKAKAAKLNTDYDRTVFPGTCQITYQQNGKTVKEAKNAGKYTASVTVG